MAIKYWNWRRLPCSPIVDFFFQITNTNFRNNLATILRSTYRSSYTMHTHAVITISCFVIQFIDCGCSSLGVCVVFFMKYFHLF